MQALTRRSNRDVNPATLALEMMAKNQGMSAQGKSSSQHREPPSFSVSGKSSKRMKNNYDFSVMFQVASTTILDDHSLYDFPAIEWCESDSEDELGSPGASTLSETMILMNGSMTHIHHKCRSSLQPSLVRSYAIPSNLSSLYEGKLSPHPRNDFLTRHVSPIPLDRDFRPFQQKSTPPRKSDDTSSPGFCLSFRFEE